MLPYQGISLSSYDISHPYSETGIKSTLSYSS